MERKDVDWYDGMRRGRMVRRGSGRGRKGREVSTWIFVQGPRSS